MYNVCDTLFGFRREIAFAGYDDRDRCLMENGIKKKNYKPTWDILEPILFARRYSYEFDSF